MPPHQNSVYCGQIYTNACAQQDLSKPVKLSQCLCPALPIASAVGSVPACFSRTCPCLKKARAGFLRAECFFSRTCPCLNRARAGSFALIASSVGPVPASKEPGRVFYTLIASLVGPVPASTEPGRVYYAPFTFL